MKLAIIPPRCWPYKYQTNYRLILPCNWQDQQHYESTMLNHRRGGFTILDNGVAEGEDRTFRSILDIARRYHVNEVVLPDVMRDAKATMNAVEDAFDSLGAHESFGLVGVVQGTTMNECYDMVNYYLAHQGYGVQTIGLPRHLNLTLCDGNNDPYLPRLELARYIRAWDKNINIHLLGLTPNYILELKDAGRAYNLVGVRGVDTSAPFVYAHKHTWIGTGDVVERPANYFDLERPDFGTDWLDINVATLKEWCNA